MVVLSVLPIGLVQTWASVEHGYAYARSPELMQLPIMQTFRWMRVPGDVLFATGIAGVVAFILGAGRSRAVSPAAGGAPEPSPAGDAAPVAAE